MKKVLSLFLCFSMILSSIFCVSLVATADTFVDGGAEFFFDFSSADELAQLAELSSVGTATATYNEGEVTLTTSKEGDSVLKITANPSSKNYAGAIGTGVVLPTVLNKDDVRPDIVFEFRVKLNKWIGYNSIASAVFETRTNGYYAADKRDGAPSITVAHSSKNESPILKFGTSLALTADYADSQNFHTIAVRYNGANSDRTIYVDGVKVGETVNTIERNAELWPNTGKLRMIFWLQADTAEYPSEAQIDYATVYYPSETFDVQVQNSGATELDSLILDFNSSISGELKKEQILVNGEQPESFSVINKGEQTYKVNFGKNLPEKTTYTVSIAGVKDALGRSLDKEMNFTTREAVTYVKDISLKGTDVLAAGEQIIQLDIANEKLIDFSPVLTVVHKAADGSINDVEMVSISTQTSIVAEIPVTVAAEDAALELFPLNAIDAPGIGGAPVEYTANGKTVLNKTVAEENGVGVQEAEYTYNKETDALTIDVSLPDRATRTIPLFVLQNGTKWEDLAVTSTLASVKETVLYATALQASAGKMTDTFVVGADNGTLPILAFYPDATKLLDESYVYISQVKAMEDFANKVNTTADEAVIGDYIATYGEYLGMDLSEYSNMDAVTGKPYLHNALIAERNAKDSAMFASLEDMIASYKTVLGYATIFYGTNGFDVLLENKALSDDAAYEVMENHMTEDAEDYLIEQLKKTPLYDAASIKEAVCENVYIAAVYKAGTYTQVVKAVEAAGGDMSDYEALKNPAKAADKLVGKLYDSTDALLEAFDDAVEARKKEESRSSGNSGNGGYAPITINPGATPKPTPTPVPITPVEPKNPFTDMENFGWANDSVTALYEKGIISGKGENTYDPEASVTRAEFIKMLAGALNVTGEGAENPFTDINENDWYFSYVLAAYEKGITGGVTDTTFAPNDVVTREMAATLLKRAAGDIFQAGEKSFNDSDKIADWAEEAVSLLAANGVINGYETGDFNPQGELNRAEAAKLIYEILKIGGNL